MLYRLKFWHLEIGSLVQNHTAELDFLLPMSSGLQQAECFPKGGTVFEGLGQSSELPAGGSGGRPSGMFPEWAPMLHALTSTLRFPRPWRPLETRSCSYNPGAAGRVIQVCALVGPDQGKSTCCSGEPGRRLG